MFQWTDGWINQCTWSALLCPPLIPASTHPPRPRLALSFVPPKMAQTIRCHLFLRDRPISPGPISPFFLAAQIYRPTTDPKQSKTTQFLETDWLARFRPRVRVARSHAPPTPPLTPPCCSFLRPLACSFFFFSPCSTPKPPANLPMNYLRSVHSHTHVVYAFSLPARQDTLA